MANGLWVPGVMMAVMDPKELSGPGSGHGRHSEDLNINFSQENSGSKGSKKRRFGAERDSNTAKADEEHPEEGAAVVIPRPRGRPKGSRNKPKALLSRMREMPNTLKSYVFEVPGGVDIRKTLEDFGQRQQMGVFILSGTGTVTNVTLRRPISPAGMTTYPGPMQIISMAGAFPRGSESEETTGITVCLADMQGAMVAGSVVGSLLAFCGVFVVAGTVVGIDCGLPNVQPTEVQSAGSDRNGVLQSSDLTETEKRINMMSSIRSLSANRLVPPPPEQTPDRMLKGVYDFK